MTKSKTYTVNDQLTGPPLNVHLSYMPGVGLIIPELTDRNDRWCALNATRVLSILSMLIALAFPVNPYENIIQLMSGGIHLCVLYLMIHIPITWSTKRYSPLRYLFIRDGQATMVGEKYWRRTYPVKDLKFKILYNIHTDYYRFLHGLCIEFPDDTLDEEDRTMMIEYAARPKILEGILCTLLPLLKGDDTMYKQSRRRKFERLTPEDRTDDDSQFLNFVDQCEIILGRYFANDILFRTKYGSYKKRFKLEIQALNQPQLEYKGVNNEP